MSINSSVFRGGFVNPYNMSPNPREGGSDYLCEDQWMFYEQPDDLVFFVLSGEEGRPDLISYRLYGNPLFGWVIMRRNGIHHKEEIKVGMRMIQPNYSRFIGFGSPLIP